MLYLMLDYIDLSAGGADSAESGTPPPLAPLQLGEPSITPEETLHKQQKGLHHQHARVLGVLLGPTPVTPSGDQNQSKHPPTDEGDVAMTSTVTSPLTSSRLSPLESPPPRRLRGALG